MQQSKKKRLLVFIFAFNAESQIESVLNRIPKNILLKYDYEILIIDDSSDDRTFEIAQSYHELNKSLHLNILFNPISQSYGGNQKLGYEYAIQNNFDVIAVLDGNGQHAPELLEELISPVLDEKADAVFGSRMLKKGEARKGGMPFYRYFGNKALTKFQNLFLGSDLSEFHSGFRAYSVQTLSEIPFERNSNDFHFDTQIIIQLLLSKKTISEIPIPTYYGDEIYRVSAFRYGWNVIKSSIASKLHQLSIFYKPQYDVTKPTEEYDLKLGYLSSHTLAISNVHEGAQVLDIGGGQGRIAKELKKKNCIVSGIDRCELENNSIYEYYYKEDLDFAHLNFSFENFDTIIMLDIIEHLANPEEFLDKLRAKTGMNQPKIIITTPNIAFIIIRIQLLLGQFNYGKQGILDKTHKRLFTFGTMKRTLRQSGFDIIKVKGIPAPFPKAIGLNVIGKLFLYINQFLIFISKKMFSYQIYMEIRPTPVVKELLIYSQKESEKRKEKLQTTDI